MSINLTGSSSSAFGTFSTSTLYINNNNTTGSTAITIGASYSWPNIYSSITPMLDYQNQIDSLKEILNLLLIINDIEIDLDEFVAMDENERIVTLRDIKIKKILTHEPK